MTGSSSENQQSKGFVVRGQPKKRTSSGENHGKSRSKSRTKFNFCKCYHKKGHIINDCQKLKNKQQKGDKKEQKTQKFVNASVAKEDTKDYIWSIDTVRPKDDWILHFHYSYHTTPDKEFFSSYE